MIPKRRFLFFCCCSFLLGCILGSLTALSAGEAFLQNTVEEAETLLSAYTFLCCLIWEAVPPLMLHFLGRSIYGAFLIYPLDAVSGFAFGCFLTAMWNTLESKLVFQIVLIAGIPTIPCFLILSACAVWNAVTLKRAYHSAVFCADLRIRREVSLPCYVSALFAFIIRLRMMNL